RHREVRLQGGRPALQLAAVLGEGVQPEPERPGEPAEDGRQQREPRGRGREQGGEVRGAHRYAPMPRPGSWWGPGLGGVPPGTTGRLTPGQYGRTNQRPQEAAPAPAPRAGLPPRPAALHFL